MYIASAIVLFLAVVSLVGLVFGGIDATGIEAEKVFDLLDGKLARRTVTNRRTVATRRLRVRRNSLLHRLTVLLSNQRGELSLGTIFVDIMDKAADEQWWSISSSRTEYSGHMHRHSPYESCDSCGNCDGANCDSCRKVTIPSRLEFSVYSDTLYQWLLEKDVPEDTAGSLAYNDSGRWSYHGYTLVWPTQGMLEERYPELYQRITTVDQEVRAVIESFRGQFEVFAYLRDAVVAHYGCDTFNGHVPTQLDLYWRECGYDHQIACSKR